MTSKNYKVFSYALFIGSLAFSALFAEVVLRRYVPRILTFSEIANSTDDPYIADYSPYLSFTLPKNLEFRHDDDEFQVTYRINEHGYRGEFPHSIKKPPGKKRVLICGDSFALGWGNELPDTFAQQIQTSLRTKEYEVINAAYHGGYSPDNYYAYLRKEGLELEPDFLIVALYTGNDIVDMVHNRWLDVDESGAPVKLDTLRFYFNYEGRLLYSPQKLHDMLPWYYTVPVLNESHLFIITAVAVNKLLESAGVVPRPLEMKDGWSRFLIVTEATIELCSQQTIPLLYVLIPPNPKLAAKRDINTHEYMVKILQHDFDVPTIDLRPLLSENEYFAEDAHFNKHGNAVTSQAILEYLEEYE